MSFGIALCICYLAGLLLSHAVGFLPIGSLALPWAGMIGFWLILLGGTIASRWLPFRVGLRRWCCLGSIFLLATIYITLRSPSAGTQDISLFTERAQAIAQTQVITGRLIDDPSLNRDLKGRFLVAVQQLQVLETNGEITFQIPVKGRVYVTAPLLQVTGLHSGQLMKAKGRLYLPKPAMNPNGFDFSAYLSQRGTFTGFVAEELKFRQNQNWGLWRLRQRIVRAQVRALGSPLGQLVSAMALGRNAVDLPADIQDLFSRVGLAHTIAASGFHVSLLLGTVLALLRSQTNTTQAIAGGGVLISYLTLTGLQASVIRATLMGAATLVGLVSDRKVIPGGALIIVVTIILLVDPTWIWKVSFQLSVAATWGLIVTAPAITRQLDWMPVTLASLLAVPIAATLWTLPLTLYHFNGIAGLSILLNVIATPIVSVISLGGIVSGAVALISPSLGALAAHLLYYPGQLLFWLAQTSSRLPGSSIAIGQITLWQIIGLYTLLGASICKIQFRTMVLKPLLFTGFLALILLPIGWRYWTQDQVTVLAAGNELIWVRQEHGHTTLVNSGGEKTAFYSVAPFLKQSGVNRIENAIALPFQLDDSVGWTIILRQTPSTHFYRNDQPFHQGDWSTYVHTLTPGQSTRLSNLAVQLLETTKLGLDNSILRLQAQQNWLLLPELPPDVQANLVALGSELQSEVLVWPGGAIDSALLQAINPQVAICYGYTLPQSIERQLQQAGVKTYWTNRDGAVIWHHHQGFRGYLETKHRNALPWG